MKVCSAALALMLTIAWAIPAAGQTTIGPGSGGPGGTFVGSFGAPNGSRAYGQTLLSPGGDLTGFTFDIFSISTPGNAQFVFAPVTGSTPGTPLFTSNTFALQTGTNTISGITGATTTAGQS